MKTFIIILIVIALLVGAAAIYLVATTPTTSAGVTLPLTQAQLDLLGRVPRGADAFALIPTAAALRGKLLANRVTRDPVSEWIDAHPLPPSWAIGSGDVAIWKSGKRTSYAVRLDAFRAFLVRVWLMTSNVDARWDGSVFVINAADEGGTSAAELTSLLDIGRGLPAADAVVVQRESGRGVFPPLARPTISVVRVTTKDIEIVSRARATNAIATAPMQARFPRGAMLAVAFREPPRVVEDLNRLLGTRVSTFLDEGGTIAIYDVNAGTLLPRPKGVFVVKATDTTRAAFADIANVANVVGETRDTGSELLVALDRTSLPLYLKDAFVPATDPANDWSMRIDPQRLVPILDRLGDSAGLRFATPRLYRAARDLRKWIQALNQAQVIEGSASTTNGTDELRVRIKSAE